MSAPTKQQSAANHSRVVVGFHAIAGLMGFAYMLWTMYHLYMTPRPGTVFPVLGAMSLMLIMWYSRQFPLAVQDRVIRLEERLRLARLLPPDMQARCDEFTPDQLIAMRFASDAELPALAQKVMTDNVNDRKAIKGMVREWRPDHMRA